MSILNPYQQTNSCWSCGGKLEDCFFVDKMPLTGRFPKKNEDHLSGDITISVCSDCSLLQLRQAYSPDDMYDQYFYQSSINNTMRKHLYALVGRILDLYGAHQPSSWLDIGCNDGFLLSIAHLLGWNTVGVDPSDVIGEFFNKSIQSTSGEFVNDIFPTPKLNGFADKSFDIITSILMFYDVSNLASFLKEINRLLSDKGIWSVEMNYTLDMARNNGYDMISHEHITYFTVKSFMKMLDIHTEGQLNLVDVDHSKINGGSITLYCSKSKSINKQKIDFWLQKENNEEIHDISYWKTYFHRLQSHAKSVYDYVQEEKS